MPLNAIKVSKFLSLVLRHKPEAIGLALDPEGWALIDELISKAHLELTPALIEQIVATSDKQRFAISDDGLSIRANQGHSIDIDLGLDPVAPPQTLYHGTASRFLNSIKQQGLRPQNRQYVHLSADIETAIKVGQRHGKPVVLEIPALQLHQTDHRFFQANNGVWLTKLVGPEYLTELKNS